MQGVFLECLASAGRVNCDFVLSSLRNAVKKIDGNLSGLSIYQDRIDKIKKDLRELSKIFECKRFDNKFVDKLLAVQQSVGELEFAAICVERKLDIVPFQSLRSESTSKVSAPDFMLRDKSAYFEVKTLARVNPSDSYKDLITQCENAAHSIKKQLESGTHVATCIIESRPYGEKLKSKGLVRGVIETISLKLCSNIKEEQFSHGETFLVCNLLELLVAGNDKEILPVYFDKQGWPKTGVLWSVGFANKGNLIFSPCEFEGLAGIEGSIDFEGVLHAKPYIKGIIWVVKFGSDLSTSMLLRQKDAESYRMEKEGYWQETQKIIGDNWNDEVDTNGWQFRV